MTAATNRIEKEVSLAIKILPPRLRYHKSRSHKNLPHDLAVVQKSAQPALLVVPAQMMIQSNELKEIVQSNMLKLDDKILRTESMLEESNGDLKKTVSQHSGR